jgi:hypothetical protein
MGSLNLNISIVWLAILLQTGPAPTMTAAEFSNAAKGAAPISATALSGNIILKAQPKWPVGARPGKVTFEAVISPMGTVAALHVVSGPMELRAAATAAVEHWRYHSSRMLIGRIVPMRSVIVVTYREQDSVPR